MHAYLFVVLATLFFSSMEVALKGLVGIMAPMQVNCTRFLLGGLFLIPFAVRELRRRKERISLHDLYVLAGLGFIGTFVSLTLFQLAVEIIPASIVAVIFCCNSIFVVLFAWLLLKAPLHRLQILAVLLSLLGMLVIIDPVHTDLPLQGLVCSVCAPVLFALYTILATPLCHRLGGVSVTCGSFLCGSLEMLLVLLLGNVPAAGSFLADLGFGFLSHIPFPHVSSGSEFLLLLYVSIAVSGCGFACYFLAQELISPMAASLPFFFKPVLAPVFAWFFLGESVTITMLAGILLVLLGSLAALVDQTRLLARVHLFRRPGSGSHDTRS